MTVISNKTTIAIRNVNEVYISFSCLSVSSFIIIIINELLYYCTQFTISMCTFRVHHNFNKQKGNLTLFFIII